MATVVLARLKPRAQNPFRSLLWLAGAHTLRPLATGFPGAPAGNQKRNKAAGTLLHAAIQEAVGLTSYTTKLTCQFGFSNWNESRHRVIGEQGQILYCTLGRAKSNCGIIGDKGVIL